MISHFIPSKFSDFNINEIKPFIIKGAIIATLLLVSAILPQYLSPRFAPLILVLPVGIGLLLAVFRWPSLRTVGVIVASMIVPLSIGTGTGSSVNAAMLALGGMAGIWVFERIVRRHPWNFIQSPTFTPLICLIAVAVLSFIVGRLPWYVLASHAPMAAQLGGLGIFILSAVAFIWVAHQLTDLRWLQLATWSFIALGTLYVVGSVIPQISFYTQRFFPAGVDGSLFWTWLNALIFSQVLLNKQLLLRWRITLAVVLMVSLYIGLFPLRNWSSGWVPSLIALLTILWLGRPKLALVMTVIGGFIIFLRFQTLLNSLIWVGDNSYSLSTRLEAWLIVGEIAKVSPILGLGPANYYWYTPLFPIRGYNVQFNSHSQFVDLFAQTGILGTFCFIWFIGKVGQLGWQLRHQALSTFSYAYVNGALGGLAGTFVAAILGDWVLPFVYNVGFTGFRASVLGWLFLGALVALERIHMLDNGKK